MPARLHHPKTLVFSLLLPDRRECRTARTWSHSAIAVLPRRGKGRLVVLGRTGDKSSSVEAAVSSAEEEQEEKSVPSVSKAELVVRVRLRLGADSRSLSSE
jgi:hypothetical protein